jgi:hypothetical protein
MPSCFQRVNGTAWLIVIDLSLVSNNDPAMLPSDQSGNASLQLLPHARGSIFASYSLQDDNEETDCCSRQTEKHQPGIVHLALSTISRHVHQTAQVEVVVAHDGESRVKDFPYGSTGYPFSFQTFSPPLSIFTLVNFNAKAFFRTISLVA